MPLGMRRPPPWRIFEGPDDGARPQNPRYQPHYGTTPARIDLKNKLSYFSIAQETITIIDPARIDLKNKLSYSPKTQETITIIGPARIGLKNKLSYSQ